MDQNEALIKINEIHSVIENNNKALFSGERMIFIGALVALIPVVELSTHALTFGHHFTEDQAWQVMLIHCLFYWALFSLTGKFLPFKKADRNAQHPLIRKAFSLTKPFMLAIFCVIFALSAVGQFWLIHPMVFILLGLMFSLYGRFTIPAVSYIAYSYIILGSLYVYLNKTAEIPNLWIYMLVYNGLSYIAMGLLLRRSSAPELN